MKKFLSTYYSDGAFNFSMLVLRLSFGLLMLINHGMAKLTNFNETASHFYNFLGMGSRTSLVLNIFAEVFCSLFLILGLFTRLATLPLIIAMLVAIFGAHAGQGIDKTEPAILYLTAYLVLLFVGPGKVSVDSMINK
jgi:putative oxidoreductase